MARLKKLPRSGHWEIDLIQIPELRVEGVELAGVLFVVHAGDGLVRQAAPMTVGDELDVMVLQAATAPAAPIRPGRPRTIRCRPALRDRLVPVAKALGASLRVTEALPAVDESAESMGQHFSAGPPPIPGDPEPWRDLVKEAVKQAPWEQLSDGVQFGFHGRGPELDQVVGVVLGQAGLQRGFVLFPTTADYDCFLDQAEMGFDAFDEPWTSWCVHLEPVDELEPSHRTVTERLGLVHEGLALQLFCVASDGEGRPLEQAEERACLAAVQGMLATCAAFGSALELQPGTCRMATTAGPLTVTTLPPEPLGVDEPLILDVDHRTVFLLPRGTVGDPPAMWMKMAKRDAVRLSGLLRGVDAISIEPIGGGEVDVRAWAGDTDLGVLTRVGSDPQLWEVWQRVGGGRLLIGAGGSKRRTLRDRDVVSMHDVTYLEDGDEHDEAPGPAMFDGTWRDEASWDGPPETWPKASTVLLDFASTLGTEILPPEAVEQALGVAANVWSAVVLADNGGDPTTLSLLRDQTRAQPAFAAMVETMIERKREEFAQDSRIMMVQGCELRDGRFDVNVVWRPANA